MGIIIGRMQRQINPRDYHDPRIMGLQPGTGWNRIPDAFGFSGWAWRREVKDDQDGSDPDHAG
jgi:hypothetical protein